MLFNDISIYSSGGHFVQRSRMGLSILVDSSSSLAKA